MTRRMEDVCAGPNLGAVYLTANEAEHPRDMGMGLGLRGELLAGVLEERNAGGDVRGGGGDLKKGGLAGGEEGGLVGGRRVRGGGRLKGEGGEGCRTEEAENMEAVC